MTIKHKRGDSLVWECEYTDDAGAPVDLTTYEIKCQARDTAGTLLFSVAVGAGITVTSAVGGLFRVQVDDTTGFGVKLYAVDIQYTIGTLVKSSETFQLEVVKDVTQ